jgi:hypothetical protein
MFLREKSMKLSVGTRELTQRKETFVLPQESQGWCLILHGKIYDENFYNYLVRNLKNYRDSSKELKIILATYRDDFFPQLELLVKELEIELVAVEDVGPLPNLIPGAWGNRLLLFRQELRKLEV